MKVRFEYNGPMDARVYEDVLSVETGDIVDGDAARLTQRWTDVEGETSIDTFHVRGYDGMKVSVEPGGDG